MKINGGRLPGIGGTEGRHAQLDESYSHKAQHEKEKDEAKRRSRAMGEGNQWTRESYGGL